LRARGAAVDAASHGHPGPVVLHPAGVAKGPDEHISSSSGNTEEITQCGGDLTVPARPPQRGTGVSPVSGGLWARCPSHGGWGSWASCPSHMAAALPAVARASRP